VADTKVEKDDGHRPEQVTDYVRKPEIVYPILVDKWSVDLAPHLREEEKEREQNKIDPPDGSKLQEPVLAEEKAFHLAGLSFVVGLFVPPLQCRPNSDIETHPYGNTKWDIVECHAEGSPDRRANGDPGADHTARSLFSLLVV
jgi:hypothetical protein